MTETTTEAEAIWSIASARLKQRNELLYQQWFCNITALTCGDGVLRLGVPDDFFGSVVSEQYDDLIADAISGIDGVDYRYEFEAGHQPSPAPAVQAVSVAENSADTAHQTTGIEPTPSPFGLKARPRLAHDFTFDNFVVSEANRHAFAAARAAATDPGLYNPLFLYGNSGVGKTHLLRAVTGNLRQNHPDWNVRCMTSDELINGFYELIIQKRSPAAYRAEICGVDALLIDDIHNLANKKQFQDDFFHIFNTLHDRGRQIVFTSDRQPCEIPGIETRLTTRFESGMLTELCMPGYEARLVILQKLREEMMTPAPLSDELLEFLAGNISSSVRRLKSSFMRLATFASLNGNNHLAISDAEQLLSGQLRQETAARGISIEDIQHAVATFFNMNTAELLGKKRTRRVAEPRMIAMYLARQLTSRSSTEIGEAFGRNHATVLHAEKEISSLCDNLDEIRRSVEQLRHQLQRQA